MLQYLTIQQQYYNNIKAILLHIVMFLSILFNVVTNIVMHQIAGGCHGQRLSHWQPSICSTLVPSMQKQSLIVYPGLSLPYKGIDTS